MLKEGESVTSGNDSGVVNADSGSVNTDSGNCRKVFTIDRNERSRFSGICVHDKPEWVFTMSRSMQPPQWQLKHCRWLLENALRNRSPGTRYHYYRTLRLVIETTTNNWSNWQHQLQGPWVRPTGNSQKIKNTGRPKYDQSRSIVIIYHNLSLLTNLDIS